MTKEDILSKAKALLGTQTHVPKVLGSGSATLEAAKAILERPQGELNAIFAFDTTGSMQSLRETVRDNLDKIIDQLLVTDKVNIMVCGVGEYCDAPYTLQMNEFTHDPQKLKDQIYEMRNTNGGGPEQVSLELLFEELNTKYIQPGKKYLAVVISDEIAHGQDEKVQNPRADYKKELIKLKKSLCGLHFVSCSDEQNIISLQKKLIDLENENELFIEFKDMMILPELLVAITKRTISPVLVERYMAQLQSSPEQENHLTASKIRGYLTTGKSK